MTAHDKTRQKLVNSMRKTKSAENKDSSAADPKAVKVLSTDKKQPKKRTSDKKAAKITTHKVLKDAYQSRGRIWPD